MASFLLFVIYVAFIGLGLPDSLFGTAWPAIYSDFNLPISYGSFNASIKIYSRVSFVVLFLTVSLKVISLPSFGL